MNQKTFELEINGKVVGFRFNMLTIGKAARLEKCSLNELFERLGISEEKHEPDLVTLIRFLFCASENYYDALSLKPVMDYGEFSDSMDMKNLEILKDKIAISFETPEIKNSEAPKESGQP